MTGCRVKLTPATKLVNELVEAADEKILTKTVARCGRVICSASTSSATWNSTAAAPSSWPCPHRTRVCRRCSTTRT